MSHFLNLFKATQISRDEANQDSQFEEIKASHDSKLEEIKANYS